MPTVSTKGGTTKVGNLQIGTKSLGSGTASKLGVSSGGGGSSSSIAPARGESGWVDPIRAPGDTKFTDQYGAPSDAQTKDANVAGTPTGINPAVPPQVQNNLPTPTTPGGIDAQTQTPTSNNVTDAGAPVKPPTPLAQAHQTLQQGPAPTGNAGANMSAVQNAKPYTPDPSKATFALTGNAGIDNLFNTIANQVLNPQVQTTSLMDDYSKLYKQSGLGDINKEMIDAETVINGTEQDIRNEIQTAGGFGTDSQVQAMSLARNKSLLTRYNQLAQMKTDATNQLNTMMSLDSQDKQMAQQRMQSNLSNMFNLANFAQQAQNNIKEGFNSLVSNVGYSGAYAAYASHPDQLAHIENVMGLAKGGLAQLASQPDYNQLLKQAQLESARANTAQSYSTIAKNNADIVATQNAKTNAIKTTASNVDETLGAVNTALKQVNPLSSGLVGGLSSFIPATPSKNLSSTIKTIQGALSLDQLAQLKANSPNGSSGLGAASDKEGEWLSSRVANLDVSQSTDQLRTNLSTIKTHYINYLQSLGYGYDQATGTVIAP